MHLANVGVVVIDSPLIVQFRVEIGAVCRIGSDVFGRNAVLRDEYRFSVFLVDVSE